MHSPTSGAKLLVAVADDDDDLRALVIDALQKDGCSTLEAHDGVELLELLRRSLDEPSLRPDVLVADVKMPRLSGLGVLQALLRAHWPLPSILITAVSDESVETVARRLGAVGVLHKPFDPDDLLTAVRNAKAARDLRH